MVRFYHSSNRRRNYGRKRYRTRYRKPQPDLLQQTITKAPQATVSRLVFKWQKNLKSFNISSFKPELTDNQMATIEMNEIFKSLASAKHYKANDGSDSVGYCVVLIMALALIFLVLFLFLVIFLGTGWYSVFFPLAFVFSYLLLLVSLFICLHFSRKWFKERLEERERSMRQILNDYNRAKYDARRIYLKVGTYGAWIEFELKF